MLWLDGVHRRYIDEVGTMNIMLRIGDEVYTPPLSDTILPGVTRDAVVILLRDWGFVSTNGRCQLRKCLLPGPMGRFVRCGAPAPRPP